MNNNLISFHRIDSRLIFSMSIISLLILFSFQKVNLKAGVIKRLPEPYEKCTNRKYLDKNPHRETDFHSVMIKPKYSTKGETCLLSFSFTKTEQIIFLVGFLENNLSLA